MKTEFLNQKQDFFRFYKEQKFNPTAFDIEQAGQFTAHQAKRENLYRRLGLARSFWKGKRVLELGCSSGENALVLADWGALLTFVEPSSEALKRLSGLFQSHHLEGQIDEIHCAFLEDVDLQGQSFDVVCAEGFLFALQNRKGALVKMSQLLSPGGMMFLSTVDRCGYFLEYSKSLIAHLACEDFDLEDIEGRVQRCKAFFAEDFQNIAHSRPVESWIKDNFLHPQAQKSSLFCYDFEQILEDIEALPLRFYNSWPSYKPAYDLTWYKNVISAKDHKQSVLEAYGKLRNSFLLGVPDLHNAPDLAEQVLKMMPMIEDVFTQKASVDPLKKALQALVPSCSGDFSKVLCELLKVLDDPRPEVYQSCIHLRKFWGLMYQFVVFERPA